MISPSSLEQDGLPGIYRENRTGVAGIESGHRLVNDVNGNHFLLFSWGVSSRLEVREMNELMLPIFLWCHFAPPPIFPHAAQKNLPEIYVAL